MHSIIDLMDGAKRFVEYAGINQNESVMLVASTIAEDSVVQAVSAAVSITGAQITITYLPPPEFYFREPPPGIAEGMCASDVILDIGAFIWGHSNASITAMVEYATRGFVLSPPPTADTLKCPAVKHPLELHRAISKKVTELCRQPDGTKFRVTSPGGTDLTAEVWQSH